MPQIPLTIRARRRPNGRRPLQVSVVELPHLRPVVGRLRDLQHTEGANDGAAVHPAEPAHGLQRHVVTPGRQVAQL